MTDAAVPSEVFRRRVPPFAAASIRSLAPGLALAGTIGAGAIELGRLRLQSERG